MHPFAWVVSALLIAASGPLSVSADETVPTGETDGQPPVSAPVTTSDPAPAAPGAEDPDSTAAPVPKTRKGRRTTREKEAEGSQAPNRFEADTVVKSKYRLDGQPLEVDPD